MKRILTGVVLGGAWLALVLYGSSTDFWLAVVLLGMLALGEYSIVILARTARLPVLWCALFGIAPLIGAGVGSLAGAGGGLFFSWFLLIAFLLLNHHRPDFDIDLVARMGMGYFYVSFCAAHLILIRDQPGGVWWVLVLTGIIAASDTGAFYAGKMFGKKKLCPGISPGKTVEGAVGGLFLGVLTGMLLMGWFFPGLELVLSAALSFLLVCVGVMGDLLESAIKRFAGVKDSGTWLAGHGGLLDRGDSILLAAPVLYYLICFGGFSV